MRIFIGLTDVANVTVNYAKGFKALGHEVFTAVWNRSYFYPNAEYDLVIDERIAGIEHKNNTRSYLRIAGQMSRLARAWNCDLFIHYAPAVLPTNLYYPILKSAGKKIVSVFWGSDVRYWHAFAEEMRSLRSDLEMAPFFEYARTRSGGSYWDKLHTIQTAEKYSDLILAQPDSGQLQSRPYMRTHIPLDLSEYKFNIPGRLRPIILHAPSVPEAKGTDVILKTIAELRDEGLDFEFRRIEKMPNPDLRSLLTDADIVVDELYSATVGGLSAEAMASGNAVLVRYMEEYSKVPPGCPAVNTNVFTLKANLQRMIQNTAERKAVAERGRTYVETVNDNITICKDILNWLSQQDALVHDFHPVFIKTYSLPNEILVMEKAEAKHRRLDFFKTLLSTGVTKLPAAPEIHGDKNAGGSFLGSIGNIRKLLAPIFGILVFGIFIYWMWLFRETILTVFWVLGAFQLLVMAVLLALCGWLTAFSFALLVRSKGYRFGVIDGFHSLNYSQLASMIPGGIWGFAGLAGMLWSKGISKADSLLILVLHTITMLTACAIIGITGLASTFGWPLALVSLLPFVIIIAGRNQLEGIRIKLLPSSSSLPPAPVMIKAIVLGALVWSISSFCFMWLLLNDLSLSIPTFWKTAGAYATGYLGGYLAIFAPSGLGISETLTAWLLSPQVGAEKALSAAIAFRIINTFIIWCNILVTLVSPNRKDGASPTQL